MSTFRKPVGPLPPRVYWRRRLLVLLGLVAVVVVIMLIVIRPGASSGSPSSSVTDAPRASGADAATSVESDPAVAAETLADGAPCEPEQIVVQALTDMSEYPADAQPNLSLAITNTGGNACVMNAGTSVQVFTITSGAEVYWTSTDCQVDPVDTEVTLESQETISSAAPIVWDRTRSSPETCGEDSRGEPVPAGGASYHLAVSVDGIPAESTKQFLLY